VPEQASPRQYAFSGLINEVADQGALQFDEMGFLA